jgi:hypothetical protein
MRLTADEFIKTKLFNTPYEMEGDRIIITGGDQFGNITMREKPYGTNLGKEWVVFPGYVEFRNKGNIHLDFGMMDDGVIFNNGGYVHLSVKDIHPNTVFKNRGDVALYGVTSIPTDLEINNKGDVSMKHIYKGGMYGTFYVEGLNSKDNHKILNLMIKKGLLTR